ncbi:hypothetical protein GGQ62_002482 [Polymorphobacter fuscus]|nr:hypothetical protein [Polymorphobacter fuscus]
MDAGHDAKQLGIILRGDPPHFVLGKRIDCKRSIKTALCAGCPGDDDLAFGFDSRVGDSRVRDGGGFNRLGGENRRGECQRTDGRQRPRMNSYESRKH